MKERYEKLMDSPEFFEELAILKAQECLSEAMLRTGTAHEALAEKLEVDPKKITQYLSSGKGLSIKTLARALYYMGMGIRIRGVIDPGLKASKLK